MHTLLLVGSSQENTLEKSYANAFYELGWQVHFWDPLQALRQVVRGGRLGWMLISFIEVEPWIRKVSRALVLRAIQVQPDLVLTFSHYPIRIGAISQLRASTNTTLVHVWPDTMVNWPTDLTVCLPLYDLVVTYSRATVPIFERLGTRRAMWVPLAGDPALHANAVCSDEDKNRFGAQVAFIGGWRPEREAVLSRLGDFNLKIWGPEWDRRCKGNRIIMKAWQKRPIFGQEFAKTVRCSQINLNIIDPTNYPAANMRFFEIPMAGGMQVSSPCPEMADTFRHGEHLLYYTSVDELPGLIASLLEDEARRNRIAATAHAQTIAEHTYTDRARAILQHLEGV